MADSEEEEDTSVKGLMSIRRLRHGSELVIIEWLWVLEGEEDTEIVSYVG